MASVLCDKKKVLNHVKATIQLTLAIFSTNNRLCGTYDNPTLNNKSNFMLKNIAFYCATKVYCMLPF